MGDTRGWFTTWGLLEVKKLLITPVRGRVNILNKSKVLALANAQSLKLAQTRGFTI